MVLVLFSLLEVFRLQLLIMEPYENGTIAIVKPVDREQIDAVIEVKSGIIESAFIIPPIIPGIIPPRILRCVGKRVRPGDETDVKSSIIESVCINLPSTIARLEIHTRPAGSRSEIARETLPRVDILDTDMRYGAIEGERNLVPKNIDLNVPIINGTMIIRVVRQRAIGPGCIRQRNGRHQKGDQQKYFLHCFVYLIVKIRVAAHES